MVSQRNKVFHWICCFTEYDCQVFCSKSCWSLYDLLSWKRVLIEFVNYRDILLTRLLAPPPLCNLSSPTGLQSICMINVLNYNCIIGKYRINRCIFAYTTVCTVTPSYWLWYQLWEYHVDIDHYYYTHLLHFHIIVYGNCIVTFSYNVIINLLYYSCIICEDSSLMWKARLSLLILTLSRMICWWWVGYLLWHFPMMNDTVGLELIVVAKCHVYNVYYLYSSTRKTQVNYYIHVCRRPHLVLYNNVGLV